MNLPEPVIQASSQGLLALLGLRNGGVSPSVLGHLVSPVFEMADWYLRSKLEIVGNGVTLAIPAANAVTVFPTLVVPNGELWFVSDFTVNFQTVAGDSVSQGGTAINGQNGNFLMGDTVAVPSASLRATRSSGSFWMSAGQGLAFYAYGNVIVGASVAGPAARITRLSV